MDEKKGFHSANDPLKKVFTPDVIAKWRRRALQNPPLQAMIDVLEACGPYPSDPCQADRLRSLRALKAAWEAYLLSASACNLLNDDILSRLRRDENGFRSAIAECMACWLFAGKMKLEVGPNAPGRNNKRLDMQILPPHGDIGIEVKAPYRPPPLPSLGGTAMWWGDDADKIAQCLEAAERQFSYNTPNILVIVPTLRENLFRHRGVLIKAAYGEHKWTMEFDVKAGKGVGPTGFDFFPEGKFLNNQLTSGKMIKADGFPAYRRVSAILCIEEKLVERHPMPDPFALLPEESRGEIWPLWKKARDLHLSCKNHKWIEHDVLVLHNPFAYHPLSQEIFKAFPQFVRVEKGMRWTDDYEIDV